MPAPYIPDLQSFITLARQGFSRKDRFVVSFMYPSILSAIAGQTMSNYESHKLSLLCEDSTLPGKLIGTRTLRINTLNEYRAAATDYLGSSISFTFYVDVSWSPRKFFEQWMSIITGNEITVDDTETSTANYSNRAVRYYDDYISSIQITALNPNPSTTTPDVPAYSIMLQEAWPYSLHSQTFSYDNKEVQKITVECVYKWWETVDVDTTISSPTADPKFTAKTTLLQNPKYPSSVVPKRSVAPQNPPFPNDGQHVVPPRSFGRNVQLYGIPEYLQDIAAGIAPVDLRNYLNAAKNTFLGNVLP